MIDFKRAAELYVHSAEAQHGDEELARYEAMHWWEIFQEVLEDAGEDE
jgi:hypothetical protein